MTEPQSEENNKVEDGKKEIEEMPTNLTISTKLSTDQLICKTPQDSPSSSVKSLRKRLQKDQDRSLLALGLLQALFGVLMVVFGALVIHYDANLSRLGAGIWGGCLAVFTGLMGVTASARCPLKSTPQRIFHTAFLALSLVSLAISQLVVALAATGAGRDISKSQYEELQTSTVPPPPGKISIVLPGNYLSILANLGLLLASFGEFAVAAVASYKCSRRLCPCFRRQEEYGDDLNTTKNALVSSWLGKHSPPPQLYVVAAPGSSLGKGSKISGSLTPVFIAPQVVAPRFIGYPLIPAPLGTIPSPIIPPSPPRKRELLRERRMKRHHAKTAVGVKKAHRPRSKSKERPVTEEEVARTYTGLDKVIAEEFIDICDSRNASLCSDSSCTSSCQRSCSGGCNSNSDVASREYLVGKT